MAFLCRLGKKDRKKKKEEEPLFGRITGSDSVDTLVRVGLEKRHGLSADSKMVALQDFTACADREMTLNQGQEAYVLYTEGSWAYVLTEDNREGFVPLSFLAPWNTTRRSISPTIREVSEDVEKSGDTSKESFSISHTDSPSSASLGSIHVFRKQTYDRYVVVFDFQGCDENDLTVEQCEIVAVLNMEDPDWYWVERGPGEEGFVPRTYLCPFPADLDLSRYHLPGYV